MKLASRILEIAALPLSYGNRKFYYGVSSDEEAREILRKGTIPVQEKTKRPKPADHVEGRSYLSASIKRASQFANCVFGTKWTSSRMKSFGRYGYLFEIEPKHLTDIFPNETEVGRFVQSTYNMQYGDAQGDRTPQALSFLVYVWGILERDEQRAIIHDDTDAAPIIGKKVLTGLPNSHLLWMLNHQVNLANNGEVGFSACYKIDRSRLQEYAMDGSNFYVLAEKVDSI